MEKSNPINNNRRKALLGISGGAVTIWHKPMISSVILPAHAITSDVPAPTGGADSFFARRIQGSLVAANDFNFLDAIIPTARAQFVPADAFFDILAERLSDTTFQVTYLSNNELNVRSGVFSTDGSTGDLIFDTVLSCATGNSITGNIVTVSDTEMVVSFNFGQGDVLEFTVPAAAGQIVTMCPVD